jgi:glutamate synthase domain-containing protein 2
MGGKVIQRWRDERRFYKDATTGAGKFPLLNSSFLRIWCDIKLTNANRDQIKKNEQGAKPGEDGQLPEPKSRNRQN